MNENVITAKDIMDRLSEMEKNMASIYDLESAVKDIMESERFDDPEYIKEAVESVSRVFYDRETTYQGLLSLYTQMYGEAKNNDENAINAKDIMDRLSEMEKSMESIYDLESAVKDIMESEKFDDPEYIKEAVESVARVFYDRETTYQGLLNLYTQMYKDTKNNDVN